MSPLSQVRKPTKGEKGIPIFCLEPAGLAAFAAKQPSTARAYLKKIRFSAKPGEALCLPGKAGIAAVLFGLGEKGSSERTLFLPGKLASVLPPGVYEFAKAPDNLRLALLAFMLDGYRFQRYKNSSPHEGPVLLCDNGKLVEEAHAIADAVCLARDLINTPANELGTDELAAAAKACADDFDAKATIISGNKLRSGFPLVHAVGHGSARTPCLVDFTWGKSSYPKVTLIGKGVVFDSGGLDIKPSANMGLMKKDMGGAANILALAQLIMNAKLAVRLRVIIPIVENAVSGTSFRPGDVFKSRKGLSVEINNTDAEGRLILADALALADEENPDLVIDMATLTGAARIALGPDLPPYYTRDEKLARELEESATREFDPLWRMPLWPPYMKMLDSKTADMSNVANNSYAGSVIAALFLSKFVSAPSWLHLDIFAWNASSRPGRPEGGEAQGIRALFALLKKRYGAGHS